CSATPRAETYPLPLHDALPISDAGRLVGIGGADAAPRRPDLQVHQPPLRGLVDRHVPGHDQVCVAAEAERAPVAVRVELGEQHLDRKSTRLNSTHLATSYAGCR